MNEDIMTDPIRAILTKIWDPIGIADEPAARDEYDAYIPEIRRLLQDRASTEQLAAYLSDLETQQMGLRGNYTRAMATAQALHDLNRRT